MCECFDKVQKLLAKQGDELAYTLQFAGGKYIKPFPIIETQRKNAKRRARSSTRLVPTFCPFCGKKYPQKSRTRTSGDP